MRGVGRGGGRHVGHKGCLAGEEAEWGGWRGGGCSFTGSQEGKILQNTFSQMPQGMVKTSFASTGSAAHTGICATPFVTHVVHFVVCATLHICTPPRMCTTHVHHLPSSPSPGAHSPPCQPAHGSARQGLKHGWLQGVCVCVCMGDGGRGEEEQEHNKHRMRLMHQHAPTHTTCTATCDMHGAHTTCTACATAGGEGQRRNAPHAAAPPQAGAPWGQGTWGHEGQEGGVM